MNLFAGELQRPSHPVQALIAGCLSAALAEHLVQRFNCNAVIEAADPGGLALRSLRRVLEYIHNVPLDRACARFSSQVVTVMYA